MDAECPPMSSPEELRRGPPEFPEVTESQLQRAQTGRQLRMGAFYRTEHAWVDRSISLDDIFDRSACIAAADFPACTAFHREHSFFHSCACSVRQALTPATHTVGHAYNMLLMALLCYLCLRSRQSSGYGQDQRDSLHRICTIKHWKIVSTAVNQIGLT